MKNRLLIIITILLFIACNKTSNQLPLIKTEPEKMEVGVTLSSNIRIDVILERTTLKNSDTVIISVRNPNSTTIENAEVVLSVCKESPANFNNCFFQKRITIKNLEAGATISRIDSIVNKDILLEESLIHFAITTIRTADIQNTYTSHGAGIYSSSVTGFYDTILTSKVDTTNGDTIIISSDTLRYYGKAKGYVDADGDYTLMFAIANDVYYTAKGTIINDSSISNGLLLSGEEIITPMTLATKIHKNKHGSLTMGFYLTKAIENGNIDSIHITMVR